MRLFWDLWSQNCSNLQRLTEKRIVEQFWLKRYQNKCKCKGYKPLYGFLRKYELCFETAFSKFCFCYCSKNEAFCHCAIANLCIFLSETPGKRDAIFRLFPWTRTNQSPATTKPLGTTDPKAKDSGWNMPFIQSIQLRCMQWHSFENPQNVAKLIVVVMSANNAIEALNRFIH